MIGQSQINERLSDMSPNRMLLDVTDSPFWREKIRNNKHQIFI